jgi:ABC-type multidrug transport system fused ATPase/permease subunit
MRRNLSIVLFLVLACLAVSFRFNANLGHASGFSSTFSAFGDSATALFAKKKPSKALISEDLLSQFDEPAEFVASASTADGAGGGVAVAEAEVDKVSLKNKKKGGKPIISSELLSSFIEEEGEEEEVEKKKKKKDKKGKLSAVGAVGAVKIVEEEVEEPEVEEEVEEVEEGEKVKPLDPNEMTIEQKVRKDKPSARVRFTESSQPGFVSMGLEKIGLMYGNEVILNDASFRVSTGDRLGLVGPNGGGKSTQLKILSGELEPTTGEILKSSANLRVAFLRQEFVEGLAMDASLKEELMTSFVEEARILAG